MSNSTIKKPKCSACRKTINESCEWGACPHATVVAAQLDQFQTITNFLKKPMKKLLNHKSVSITKSILRIVACYYLAYYNVQLAALLLIVAESLGILEELV